MPSADDTSGLSRWKLITISVLLLIAIFAGGLFYYDLQKELVSGQVSNNLVSIANVKNHEIASWRSERLGNARIISQDPGFRSLIIEYLRSHKEAQKEQILAIFSLWKNTIPDLREIRFVDSGHSVLISTDPEDTNVTPYLDSWLFKTSVSGEPILTSFSRSPRDNSPVLYAIAPVTDFRSGKPDISGFIILEIDPAPVLYPLIQSWPVPSRSAETLLVEEQNNSVLFLNRLRNMPDSALNLTIPVSQTDVPAVQAVLGSTGAFMGTDYRGVSVISVIQPVPDSPWFMVAKIDTTEAFASWNSTSGLIIIIVAGTLAGAVILVVLFWQRRQKYYYHALYDAEAARRESDANAQASLRASEEKYRAIIDTMQDAYFQTDARGIITMANPAAARMYGYESRDEMIGLPISALYQSNEERLNLISSLDAEGKVNDYTGLGKKKDGSTFWISINVRVGRDPGGNILSSQGFVRDISERRRIEALILDANAVFSQAEAMAHVGSWQYVPTSERIEWSDETFRIFGYEPGQFTITLENIRNAIHPDDRAKHDKVLASAAATGHYDPEEYRLIRPDGTTRVVYGNARVFFNESGEVSKIIGVIHDITEQKHAEEQREALIRELEQKNAELERFTYTISHDLKSPLITILGFTDLIEADALERDHGKLEKDLGRIREAAKTMQSLLGGVLELSRIGRVISPAEEFPLGTVAEEACDLLAVPIAESRAGITIDSGLPVVTADRQRIREVLVNLIENAVKYSESIRKPEIRIGARYDGPDPVFFVKDNGIGIDPRYHERVFNLFEKLNPSYPGTGVGLTIVKRIIEVHGGKIWVESEGAGKGTAVCFTLPGPERSGK